jgi:hypothetical protein
MAKCPGHVIMPGLAADAEGALADLRRRIDIRRGRLGWD